MQRKPHKKNKLITALLMLAATGAVQAQEKTLKIYGIGAKSGVVGIFGQQSEAAMQAAAAIINKSGGVTLGDGSKAKLVIDYLDDRCNPEEGINAAQNRLPDRCGRRRRPDVLQCG